MRLKITKKSPKRESYLAKKSLGWLNRQPGTLFFKIHGGSYQSSGISDLIGLVNGRFVAIELKVGSNTPTKLQSYFPNIYSEFYFRNSSSQGICIYQELIYLSLRSQLSNHSIIDKSLEIYPPSRFGKFQDGFFS